METTGNQREMAMVITGRFTDPGFDRPVAGTSESFTLTIDWGDGMVETVPSNVVQGDEGVLTRGTFSTSHIYEDGAIYTATVTVTDDDGGSDTQSFQFGVACIDVVPAINLKQDVVGAEGRIPVKICVTPEFDATTIDVSTLRFGPAGALESHGQLHNAGGGGGFVMTHFKTRESGIRPTDRVAFASGRLADGTLFVGMDEIRIVPGSSKGPNGATPAGTSPEGNSKFFVADADAGRIFRYSPSGAETGYFTTDSSIVDVRGATIDVNHTVWTVGTTQQVARQEPDGTPDGSWRAFGIEQPEGIATDGTDVWIVDAASHEVHRFAAAAVFASAFAIAVPTETFNLHTDNTIPSGITTDGTRIWVSQNNPAGMLDEVFVYGRDGSYQGRWLLDPENTDVTGITRSLTDASLLWTVDRLDRTVYKYAGVTNKLSGSQSASTTFSLVAANTRPEGIADPVPNEPPEPMDDEEYDVSIGVPVDIQVLDNDYDPEGDPLTITSVTTSSEGTVEISPDGSYVTYTAGSGFGSGSGSSGGSGSPADSFQYTVDDGQGNSATATVYLYPAPPNQPPTAEDDAAHDVAEGTPVDIFVRDNDYDPEGDPLTITSVTTSSEGMVEISPDGSYVTYTAGSGFGSGGSSSGTADDTFEYTIDDGQGNTATATVYIYAAVNSPPTAEDDDVPDVDPDLPKEIFVLSNDSDFEGDPLTITGVTTPSYGTATFSPDGQSIVYEPGTGFGSTGGSSGTPADSFQYTIDDGHGNTATATVRLYQTHNDPPTATDDEFYDLEEGIAVDLQVRDNDFDPDDDPLTITDVTNPSAGSVTMSPDGTYVTYTPGTGFGSGSGGSSGTPADSFEYTIDDGHGNTATATVQLYATVNTPPFASDDHVYEVRPGDSLQILVRENDFDEEGDPLTITGVTLANEGTATISPDGEFITYVAGSGFGSGGASSGEPADSFQYTIDDGHGNTSTATVSLYPESEFDEGDPDQLDFQSGTSNDPEIHTDVTALDIARAITVDLSILTGAAFESVPNVGRPNAVAEAELTEFPGHGPTYGILSSGDATLANNPGEFSSVDLLGESVRGDSDFDVTALRIDLMVPEGFDCLSFDFQFLSEEFPVYVGTEYNDAFIAELDNSTWTTTFSEIVAPNNFAFDLNGDPVSINSTGVIDMSPEHGLGTAYDGGLTPGEGELDFNGAATPLLRAMTPITSGAHSLYLSIFDQGDWVLDSAVFLDNLQLGVSGPGGCAPGISRVIDITASAPAPKFEAGTEVLLTGEVLTNADVASVLVNGTAVDAVDAAKHFFTTVTVGPGENVFEFVGTDVLGATASTTLVLEGVLPSNEVDFETLTDVSISFRGEYDITSYQDGRHILDADLSILNDSQYLIDAPLLVGITHVSEASVRVHEPDGVTPDGIPYFNYTDLIDDGTLSPSELTEYLRVSFENPLELPFTYDLVLLGQLNRPPAFVTAPTVQAVTGQEYVYDFDAADPDENAMTYTLLSGPAGATFDAVAGAITWTPQTSDVGNHQIRLLVEDGRGGSAEQRYVLTVLDPPPNRPPFFTSLPELAGYVNVEYLYPPTATDPDGDSLTYRVVEGPTDFIYDASSGRFRWTPSADSLGPHTVTVQAADPAGEIDEQTFTIFVGPEPGNADPVILTEPATTAVLIGEEFTYDVDAIDPNDDDLAYELITAPAGMTIDALSGEIAWTTTSGDAGSHNVNVRVTDGRGGVDEQSFSVDVQSAAPAEIRGTIFEDLDSDGLHDAGESGLADWTVFLDQNQDGIWQLGERFASTDAAGDYVLTALPAGVFTVAQIRPLGWLQTAPANKTHTMTLSSGESSTGHDFGNVQSTLTDNEPPSIDNLPSSTVAAGDLWTFDALASDPNGDVLAFDLPVAPIGMTINADSGRAVWEPTPDQVGTHDVVFRVRDGQGGAGILDFSVEVFVPNTHPLITSEPDGPATVGKPFEYQVIAQDAENHPLTYSLTGPSGMTIDADSGRVTWPLPVEGTHHVEITVSDGHGGSYTQIIELPTVVLVSNDPPLLDSQPNSPAVAGRLYTYDMDATDPNGDVLTYSLEEGAEGMQIDSQTGLLTWTPTTADVGDHDVVIVVRDGRGGRLTESFTLPVVADAPNELPEITSTPPGPAVADYPYEYQVVAQDADGDPLTFQLDSAPPGMTVDPQTGLITWTPTFEDAENGSVSFAVSVTDGRTGSHVQTVELPVELDSVLNDGPIFDSTPHSPAVENHPYVSFPSLWSRF